MAEARDAPRARSGPRRDVLLSVACAAWLLFAATIVLGVSAGRYLDDDACGSYRPPEGNEAAHREGSFYRQRVSIWPLGATCEWRSQTDSGSYTLAPSTPVQVVLIGLVGAAIAALLAGLIALFLDLRAPAAGSTRPPEP